MIRNQFENFLRDSFGNGIAVRELRLSDEEVAYMKANYPMAILHKTGGQDSTDGRCWYEIRFTTPPKDLANTRLADEIAAIRAEKERLQRELLDAKRELDLLKQKQHN